jgi:hypothetical protein
MAALRGAEATRGRGESIQGNLAGATAKQSCTASGVSGGDSFVQLAGGTPRWIAVPCWPTTLTAGREVDSCKGGNMIVVADAAHANHAPQRRTAQGRTADAA